MASAQVLHHSSIRISGEKTVYIDPFKVSGYSKDADVIFVTHDHFDHYSEEDIKKVMKEDTTLVVPRSLEDKAKKLCGRVIVCASGEEFSAAGIKTEVVPAYNIGKPFHPKSNGWVGYILTIDGTRYYIAGDTDENEDILKVRCDVAFLPIGGHFTMDAAEAAAFVGKLKPAKVIPTHYGDVAGSPADAVFFEKNVPDGIEVEVQLKF